MKLPHSNTEKAATDAAHDAWFRAKVQEALDDPRPGIPHQEVEAGFAKRRAAALRNVLGIGAASG